MTRTVTDKKGVALASLLSFLEQKALEAASFKLLEACLSG